MDWVEAMGQAEALTLPAKVRAFLERGHRCAIADPEDFWAVAGGPGVLRTATVSASGTAPGAAAEKLRPALAGAERVIVLLAAPPDVPVGEVMELAESVMEKVPDASRYFWWEAASDWRVSVLVHKGLRS